MENPVPVQVFITWGNQLANPLDCRGSQYCQAIRQTFQIFLESHSYSQWMHHHCNLHKDRRFCPCLWQIPVDRLDCHSYPKHQQSSLLHQHWCQWYVFLLLLLQSALHERTDRLATCMWSQLSRWHFLLELRSYWRYQHSPQDARWTHHHSLHHKHRQKTDTQYSVSRTWVCDMFASSMEAIVHIKGAACSLSRDYPQWQLEHSS